MVRIIENRPDAWIEHVANYVTVQGYGLAHRLEGLEGVFWFYETLQELEEEIITHRSCNKLIFDIQIGNGSSTTNKSEASWVIVCKIWH